ncbi:MAG: hypothetical protein ACOCUR_02225 [Nanoarchaeota archaeon]
MGKFEEADERLFKNIYVDKVTKKKIRAPPLKVLAGKIKGRGKQGTRKLRPKRKK